MELTSYLTTSGWKQVGDDWISRGGTRFRIANEAVPQSLERSPAPFLAKALLEARAQARPPTRPLGVLTVRSLTPLVHSRLEAFVGRVAPGTDWIVMDRAGRVAPHVEDAQELTPTMGRPATELVGRRPPSLFSDLNQWLLKILLGQHLPERLITVPRRPLRNASTLAEAADVSIAATSRFLGALEKETQLDTRLGDLRIARPAELLKQWRDQSKTARTHPSRQDVGVVSARQPFSLEVLCSVAAASSSRRPPLVLRGPSACKALGLDYVSGGLPEAWVVSFDQAALDALGFIPAPSGKFDVILSLPTYPESVFRALVRDGAPTSDVIQCWLDASVSRVRGEEQASFIWRKVLGPAFER